MLSVEVSDRPMAAAQMIEGWSVDVKQRDPAILLRDATHVLSATERARFDAMTARDAADLRRAAHVIKRETVGARLGLTPAAVPFAIDTPRPILRSPHADTHVSFSHTRGAVAVVVADTRVGIDIEPIASRGDPARLAARYFATDEARLIGASDQSPFEFAWRWVAKEALLKARGLSLGAALATSLGAAQRNAADLPFNLVAEKTRITLFAPARGFICAVAR